jgi:hypothetical protein
VKVRSLAIVALPGLMSPTLGGISMCPEHTPIPAKSPKNQQKTRKK